MDVVSQKITTLLLIVSWQILIAFATPLGYFKSAHLILGPRQHATQGNVYNVMRISVMVAGANRIASETLCCAFQQNADDFDVIGSAFTCEDLLQQVAAHQPQVAIISVKLQDGPTAGIKAVRELRASNCSTRAVVLLDYSDPELVTDAFSAGARGVICSTDSFRLLCKCVRCVHAGQIWADSCQLLWVVESLGKREPCRIVSAKGTALLTNREEQIVRVVVDGSSNNDISSKLGVSVHTVRNHLYRIYEKLGISNRIELVLYALKNRGGPQQLSVKTQQDADGRESSATDRAGNTVRLLGVECVSSLHDARAGGPPSASRLARDARRGKRQGGIAEGL
jgi:DNA-binding NarL/FixJ family response regulator